MRILWSGLKLWRPRGYPKFKLHNVDVPDVQSYFYDMDIFPLAFVGVTVQGDRFAYWLLDSGKLGHKNIKNTLIYTHRVNFESDEYHSTVAKTAEEARKLIETGFEYVCTTPEDLMLFKKRK